MSSKRPSMKKILAIILIIVAVGLILRGRWKGPEDNPPGNEGGPVVVLPSGAEAPASFSEVAKALDPVVVNIFTTKTVRSRVSRDNFFRHFFPTPRPRKQRSLGSGFLIDSEGYILTNNHVVVDSDEIRVQFTDERVYRAVIIGLDTLTDLALIKIDGGRRKFSYATLGDSDALNVGDWVVAMGNPFGIGSTITAGIVSAKERGIQNSRYDNFIQTDASINPGNSGGPLVNIRGEVVAINSAIYSKTGGSVGIGFAIPINFVKQVLSQLKDDGKITRAWLGVVIRHVTPGLAESVGLDEPTGGLIVQIFPHSPAHRYGLKEGDIVIEIDGHIIGDENELMRVISLSPVGSKVKLKVLRKGKEKEIKVVLGRDNRK